MEGSSNRVFFFFFFPPPPPQLLSEIRFYSRQLLQDHLGFYELFFSSETWGKIKFKKKKKEKKTRSMRQYNFKNHSENPMVSGSIFKILHSVSHIRGQVLLFSPIFLQIMVVDNKFQIQNSRNKNQDFKMKSFHIDPLNIGEINTVFIM